MWLIYSTTISSLMLPQRLRNEPEKERTSQVALEEKHKILCHGKHLTSVLQCPGWAARNGFWVCFSSSQQGSNIILLVVSSSEVFLLPCSVTWHYCYIVAQHVPCSLFNCFDPVNRDDWGKHTGRKEGKVERSMARWSYTREEKCVCACMQRCRCTVLFLFNTHKNKVAVCCCGHPAPCYWKYIDSCSVYSVWWMTVS